MERNKQVDEYIELRFGKPDYTRSFIKEGMVWTPIGTQYQFWRVESIEEVEMARLKVAGKCQIPLNKEVRDDTKSSSNE